MPPRADQLLLKCGGRSDRATRCAAITICDCDIVVACAPRRFARLPRRGLQVVRAASVSTLMAHRGRARAALQLRYRAGEEPGRGQRQLQARSWAAISVAGVASSRVGGAAALTR